MKLERLVRNIKEALPSAAVFTSSSLVGYNFGSYIRDGKIPRLKEDIICTVGALVLSTLAYIGYKYVKKKISNRRDSYKID